MERRLVHLIESFKFWTQDDSAIPDHFMSNKFDHDKLNKRVSNFVLFLSQRLRKSEAQNE